MKKIITRLFYWDQPAAGALLGITLAGPGSWLWFCLFHTLFATGCLESCMSFFPVPALAWLIGQMLILLYGGFLLFRFFDWFCTRHHTSFSGRYGWYFGFCLFPAIGGASFGMPGFLGMLLAALYWYLPLLLWPQVKMRNWLANALTWSLGSCGLFLWGQILYHRTFVGDFLGYYRASRSLEQFLSFCPISGSGWLWVFLAGLLLLLTGYFLFARMLAVAGEVELRRLFGKGVLALWAALLLANLLGIGAALWAARDAAVQIARLERHFGRPLTAAALEEVFLAGQKPDSDFWSEAIRQEKLLKASLFPEKYDVFASCPNVNPSEFQTRWRGHYQTHAAEIAALEKNFDQLPPLPLRNFVPGLLSGTRLPELGLYRSWCRLERWQLEFAIQRGDIAAAREALRRMNVINAAARRENLLDGSLVWLACENIRLDGLERLLESGMLPDTDWQQIADDLAAREALVREVVQRALFSDAVCNLDIFEFLSNQSPDVSRPFPCSAFRWFFPVFWYQFARDKAAMAQAYRSPDFSRIKLPRGTPFILCHMLLSVLPKIGYKFDGLIARFRAMRALINADAFRRRNGFFPEKLENLPLDPFSGKPLLYRRGNAAFSTLLLTEATDGVGSPMTETQWIHLPAVQIWSIGPNQLDDSGLTGYQSDTQRNADDIRAMLRLNEMPKK